MSKSDIINHRYRVVRELGRGAQAMVLAVEDTLGGNERVALKVLHEASMESLFRFEFAQAKRLEHPHLARVYDLDVVQSIDGALTIPKGAVFFTQELVPGESCQLQFSGLPKAERPARAAALCVAVARALELIHGHGLLHRDVKPSNILVGNGGKLVKLIDLGLSTHKDALDGLRAGTLGYTPPEALHGFFDERSDLFSLGVTLRELLTGEAPPLVAGPIGPAPAHVPAKLWELTAKLVHPLPERRPQSARETLLALARAAGAGVLGDDQRTELIDAASDTATPTTRAARVRSPNLVGRDGELSLLVKWLEGAASSDDDHRTTRTLWLAGAPGVGKTRLFRAAVVEAQLAAVRNGDRPMSFFSGSLRELMRRIAPSRGGSLHHLSTWISGVVSDEKRAGEPGHDALLAEIADTLLRLKHPSAVLIEDGDSPLVGELIRRLNGLPADGEALAIAAERRDTSDRDTAEPGGGPARIPVSPLGADDERAIIRHALGRAPDDRMAERLHQMTGGLPLLTEAALAALLALRPDGIVAAKSLESLDLSDTLDDLILEGFLEGLSAPALAVAESLAVLDGPATGDELAIIANIKEVDDLFSAIRELERKGWLHRNDGELILKRLVAAGLRRTLTPSRTRALSTAVLAVLERRPFRDPGRLARYAAQAGMTEKAAEFARAGAAVLRASGDLLGAADQLTLLAGMALPPEERSAVQTELAKVCRQTGQYDRAISLAREVEERGGALAPRATLERAAALRLAGAADEAASLLDDLMRSRSAEVAAEARAIAARTAFDSGDLAAAAVLLEGIDDLRAADPVRTGALSTRGLIALARGETEQARALFEAGLDIAVTLGDLRTLARFNGLLGMVFHTAGKWHRALASYQAALDLAERAGDRHGGATYAVNLAAALTELGRIPDALAAYRSGLRMLRIIGRPSEIARAGANYAELLLRIGDVDTAQSASGRSVADAKRSDDRRALALALCVQGDVLIHLGKLKAAKTVLSEAEAVASKAGAAQELATSRLHLAALGLKQGDRRRASEWLAQVTAGRDEAPFLHLEHRRLMVEAALLGAGEPRPAFDALFDSLPAPGEPLRSDHVRAFVTAARCASKLRLSDHAGALARSAVQLIHWTRAQTPAIHRPEETSLLKEMKMIADTDSAASKSPFEASWEHLVRINARLNSEVRVGRLLDMIMDAAVDITGAERGFLLIVNGADDLEVRSARNMDQQSLVPGERSFSRTVAKRAFTLGEPVLTTDASEDERFHDRLSVVNLNLRYIVAVPLRVRGTVIGTIYLDSRRGGRFDDGRIALLEALATQAAIALTNARLRAENRQRQQRIERLNRELESELKTREGELARVRGELEKRTDELITKYRYDDIVARSKPMAEVFRVLDKVVDGDVPVILEGESGTGKELAARAIHFNGRRKRKAFVAENCAAIPETLLESVLFGHVKGAFTGAVSDNRGLFVEADGGTLFLDEIAEMPLSMQTKLLRVLQDGEVRPVGGARTVRVDVRILVASNMGLQARVKQGSFREDLFYRLNVIRIELPPLRKRREDIPLLADHFIQKHRGRKRKQISKAAIEALMDFHWPGNVRQLENEIIRALVLSGDVIDFSHLSEEIVSDVSRLSEATIDLDMSRQVDRLKRRLIAAALKRTEGNQTAAAKLLGVSRYGLQKMMTRLDQEGRNR